MHKDGGKCTRGYHIKGTSKGKSISQGNNSKVGDDKNTANKKQKIKETIKCYDC